MNTLQLQDWLQREVITRRVYGRVCALNQLPFNIQRRPSVYIVNSQPSSKPGRHWFVLYFPRVGPSEFFDSLGRRPGYYSWRLERYLKNHGGYFIYNAQRYQQVGTTTCGQFCLYFTYQRCLGRGMRDIIGDFDVNDLNYNEAIVNTWIMQLVVEKHMDSLALE